MFYVLKIVIVSIYISFPFLSVGENDDGWETVHRGGRLRSRNSPSQKSLENLSKCSDNQKKNLQRSKSVPDSTSTDDSVVSVQNTAIKSVSEKTVNKMDGVRERAGSKESEKENIPQADSKIGDGHVVSHSPCVYSDISDKEKLSGDTSPDKEKLSGDTSPDKEKLSGDTSPDKEKLSGDTSPDKEKLSGDTSPDKEKLSGDTSPDKEKLSGESGPDKLAEKSFSSDEGHDDNALIQHFDNVIIVHFICLLT